MNSTSSNQNLLKLVWVMTAMAGTYLSSPMLPAQQASANEAPAASAATPAPTSTSASAVKTFDTPQQAADALINAAEQWDETALAEIFGTAGDDIVFTGDTVQDRQRATDFAAEAREKKAVSVDPKVGNRAFLLVG